MAPTTQYDVITGPSFAKPRSRRMGIARPPSDFQQPRTSTSTLESAYSFATSSSASPPLPSRSARRPAARSIAPQTPPQTESQVEIADPNQPMPLHRNRSFASMSGLLDALDPQDNPHDMPKGKHNRSISDTTYAIPPVDDEADSSNSSLASQIPAAPSVSKRTHALLELLSSERAYASDLALIRDIHIPLALGIYKS
jgi:dynamin-binding protein